MMSDETLEQYVGRTGEELERWREDMKMVRMLTQMSARCIPPKPGQRSHGAIDLPLYATVNSWGRALARTEQDIAHHQWWVEHTKSPETRQRHEMKLVGLYQQWNRLEALADEETAVFEAAYADVDVATRQRLRTHFAGIEELSRCPVCWGTGKLPVVCYTCRNIGRWPMEEQHQKLQEARARYVHHNNLQGVLDRLGLDAEGMWDIRQLLAGMEQPAPSVPTVSCCHCGASNRRDVLTCVSCHQAVDY